MIYAMAAMVLLTTLIGIYTVVGRIRSVSSGAVKIKTYRTMAAESMPERLLVAGRSFNNQFEVPLLFYVVGTLFVVLEAQSWLVLGLAWAFVASRYLQAIIHLTYNNVLHRMLVFILGFIFVLALWIQLLLAVN